MELEQKGTWNRQTKRQQEITVFFPAARSYTRFLAKRHIFCPRFQSVFVLSSCLLSLQLLLHLSRVLCWGVCEVQDLTDFIPHRQSLGEVLLDLLSPGCSLFGALISQIPGCLLRDLLPPKTQHIKNELSLSFPGFPPCLILFPAFFISSICV